MTLFVRSLPTNPLDVAEVIRQGTDVSPVTNEQGHLPQRVLGHPTPSPCEAFIRSLSSVRGNRRPTDHARTLATVREASA